MPHSPILGRNTAPTETQQSSHTNASSLPWAGRLKNSEFECLSQNPTQLNTATSPSASCMQTRQENKLKVQLNTATLPSASCMRTRQEMFQTRSTLYLATQYLDIAFSIMHAEQAGKLPNSKSNSLRRRFQHACKKGECQLWHW
eukprot:1149640-Pelagomonas_calceolata.AAC.1